MLDTDMWSSFIFWGPPGTGKTTLATVIAGKTKRKFEARSAVTSGVKELKEVLEGSKKAVSSGQPAWILFVDEVHRLNKAQQDILLPYLEDGSVRFIGATTENPSFEINNAICSRSVILKFKELRQETLIQVLKNAAKDHANIQEEVFQKISDVSLGDARRALMLLEHLTLGSDKEAAVTIEDFEKLKDAHSLYYDKSSDRHYDTISAFIKSVRGSDPDAALYYMARMLEGGEDPLFIARRLIILASEDVGNANPTALVIATSAFQAVHAIGMPEARIILAQAATYLASSEKSNRAYKGMESALETVRQTGNLEIPYSIRNAPTSQMKDWGYGKDYKNAHNADSGWQKMQFLPDPIKDKQFYKPSVHGRERALREFLSQRGKSFD